MPGILRLPPEAFFAGPGLDRADLLRTKRDVLTEMAARHEAGQLAWSDGIPLLDDDGRLVWDALQEPTLFLGLDGEAPRFSPLPKTPPSGFAFGMLGQLADSDAPLFACALSLANWHGRHHFCSACGHSTGVDRGGRSRRCPACGVQQIPR